MAKTILIIMWLAAAACCTVYGIAVRAVGSGTLFFVVWLFLAVVFVFFAYAVKIGLWGMLPGAARRIFITLVVFGFSVFLIIEGIILSGFKEKGKDNLDYIIVLGAQVYENSPSPVLKFRLDKAIEYLNDNPDTVCVVSGGQGANEPFAEAAVMAQYLEENGISSSRILKEDQSENTEQNIRYCMEMIGADASVGIVTNNFHVYRAVRLAKREGMTNVCGIAADTLPAYLPNNMLREFMAIIKMRLKELL